jgi:hypothetical protein
MYLNCRVTWISKKDENINQVFNLMTDWIEIVKVVRDITSLGMKQSKDVVDTLRNPSITSMSVSGSTGTATLINEYVIEEGDIVLLSCNGNVWECQIPAIVLSINNSTDSPIYKLGFWPLKAIDPVSGGETEWFNVGEFSFYKDKSCPEAELFKRLVCNF